MMDRGSNDVRWTVDNYHTTLLSSDNPVDDAIRDVEVVSRMSSNKRNINLLTAKQ